MRKKLQFFKLNSNIESVNSNIESVDSKLENFATEVGFGLDWNNPKSITSDKGGTIYTCEFSGYMYENQTCSTSLTAQLSIDGVKVHNGGNSGNYSSFQTFVKKGQVISGRGTSGSNVFTYNIVIYPLI